MATNIQKDNLVKSQEGKYKSRAPYYNQLNHLNDNIKNMGYDYRGKIYKKTTSPELWGNPLQIPFIGRLEAMMTLVLEHVKAIKKTFSIAHSKDSLNIKRNKYSSISTRRSGNI